jgi:hypothetical protein
MAGAVDKTDVNERFNQIILVETAIKTTLDTVLARHDALTTTLTEMQKDRDHRRGVCHPTNDSFATILFNIPSYNGKYDPAAYLDWELEVDQQFLCHDITANSQITAILSAFTDFALMWWRQYKQHHSTNIPITWSQLKAAMRHQFVPSYYK